MAAQTVVASMTVRLTITETLAYGVGSGNYSSSLVPDLQLVAGNSATANAINQYFVKSTTLNSGANTTFVLTALTDDNGLPRSFANGVKGLKVYATTRTAGDFLTMGNAASAAWVGICSSNTATIRIADFASFDAMSTDKFVVANGSSEQLKFVNAGNSAITFKLIIWGNT